MFYIFLELPIIIVSAKIIGAPSYRTHTPWDKGFPGVNILFELGKLFPNGFGPEHKTVPSLEVITNIHPCPLCDIYNRNMI